jgi:hypothetical protein
LSTTKNLINVAFGTQISDFELEQFLCRLCQNLIKDVHEHHCEHCINQIVQALQPKSEPHTSFKASSGVTIK